MITEDDFWRAVRATPDDDTPRLAYADWLDEQPGTAECRRCGGAGTVSHWYGDNIAVPVDCVDVDCGDCSGTGRVPGTRASRAELIRVQCELARQQQAAWWDEWKAGRLTSQDPAIEHGGNLAALRKRERELLDRHVPSPCGLPSSYVAWERGFVARYEGVAEPWVRTADALLAEHPVREAVLTTWPHLEWQDDPATRTHRYRLPGRAVIHAVTDRELASVQVGAMSDFRRQRVESLLAEEWPGVRFTLPATAVRPVA